MDKRGDIMYNNTVVFTPFTIRDSGGWRLMLQNIQLQVSALIPMLIICYFSFSDRGVTLKSDWLY